MKFTLGAASVDLDIAHLIVAGWTGRDRGAVDHHIAELAALGVAPPSDVPLFYRVSAGLLTQAPTIQVLGPGTSGEVEPLVIRAGGATWLGLASDHTDRDLETVSVAASKQACPKPVSATLWAWDEVAGHLDKLVLRTEIEEAGAWVPYQQGAFAGILPLTDLMARTEMGAGTAMLCGTLAAQGGVRPARAYRMTLEDPVLGRAMTLAYDVEPLPIIE